MQLCAKEELFLAIYRCQNTRMSKKTLNKDNLTSLGVDRLADLLLEVSTGSAEIKRRLRLELIHNQGPDELAHEVRKRLATLRKSTSFIGWRKRKALIKDLTIQVSMITDKIGNEAPIEAFDLLWSFIELAPSVYQRVDDSRGEIREVFQSALMRFEDIAPRAVQNPQALSERVWEALLDNGFGEFDGIIGLVAPTLGKEGLEHLADLVKAHAATPLETSSEDHAALVFLRELRSSSGDYAAEQKLRLTKRCLQEIAEALGDTEAYIAQYSEQELRYPEIAAEVATLLLDSGQNEEALEILRASEMNTGGAGQEDWDACYVACLIALDRREDAQTHRWDCFLQTLHVGHLRAHLKDLPDFDDIEVEDRAKQYALQFSDMAAALEFFLDLPDLSTASQLVQCRTGELAHQPRHILAATADALWERHPLSAVLLSRAMIEIALNEGWYGDAANHFNECAARDREIASYGSFISHEIFADSLQTRYPGKPSFWAKVQ